MMIRDWIHSVTVVSQFEGCNGLTPCKQFRLCPVYIRWHASVSLFMKRKIGCQFVQHFELVTYASDIFDRTLGSTKTNHTDITQLVPRAICFNLSSNVQVWLAILFENIDNVVQMYVLRGFKIRRSYAQMKYVYVLLTRTCVCKPDGIRAYAVWSSKLWSSSITYE